MTTSHSTDHLKQTGKATGTFFFKHFKVEDSRSTMKVGTDAVLLGATADVSEATNILEIGTGCGVIALMLAQRSEARIDAIDIDEASVGEARKNTGNSPWKDRITVIHRSLQDHVNQTEEKYDLIVSNPPYFSRSLKSPKESRNISRHNDMLSFDDLVSCSTKLMTAEASIWVILPVKESEEFIESASEKGFFIHFQMKIFPKTGQCQHRNIFQLKRISGTPASVKYLNIRNADGSSTEEYKKLTKEFYLDF
jgi:tRNA1Val (adenine37-N6)-methyltransferase